MMGIPTIKDKLKFLIHPTGSNFRPNLVIKVIRIVAILIQRALFVSGKTRWGNEFIQVQNPLCETEMNAGIDDVPTSLILRTGHGRLFFGVLLIPQTSKLRLICGLIRFLVLMYFMM